MHRRWFRFLWAGCLALGACDGAPKLPSLPGTGQPAQPQAQPAAQDTVAAPPSNPVPAAQSSEPNPAAGRQRVDEILQRDPRELSDADLAVLASAAVELENLKRLDLTGASITDGGVKHLTALPNLSEVCLTRTEITDQALPTLASMPKLTRLSIADCTHVTGAGLVHLNGHPSLTWLDLASLPRDTLAEGMAAMKELPSLEFLGLSAVKPGPGMIELLKAYPSLTRLDLSYLEIPSIPAVSKLTGLTELRLEFSEIDDRSLVPLTALKKLESLHLGNTRITDNGLQVLRRFPALRHLVLRQVGISDNGTPVLKNLRLETLNLEFCTLSDPGFAQLNAMTPLKTLYLANTSITDAGLRQLATLPNLQRLSIRETSVTAAGVLPFKHLTHIEYAKSGISPQEAEQLCKQNPNLAVEWNWPAEAKF